MTYDDSAPQNYKEAQGVIEWEKAMHEEMEPYIETILEN